MTDTNTAGTGDASWDEIANYVSDQMTAEARATFEHRLAGDSVLRATVERARGAMGAWEPVVDGAALDDARAARWARVWKSRARRPGQDYKAGFGGGIPARFAHSRDDTRGWIAAVCVVVLVFTALWVRRPSADRGVTRTIITSAGEQRQFELHDGTQVLLSPNSTLQLANFGASSRTVTVRGEAYFDVPHASGVPFIVRSGDATVRVLGTTFLVNSRHDGRHSHVVVLDGRVSMAGTNRSAAIISRGQVGDVADSTVRVSEANDLTPGVELRQGNFIFHDTPLARVLQTLSRWYGYEFRCNDSALMHRVVNVPLSQRSSAAAVSTLQELLDVKSTVVGDTITLIAHPPARKHAPAQTRPYNIFVPTREVGR
jgi:ferric-dicitrate binding protein FerR (iron transport regulator)